MSILPGLYRVESPQFARRFSFEIFQSFAPLINYMVKKPHALKKFKMENETNSSGASVSSSSLDPSSSSSKKQHFELPTSEFPQLLLALLEDAENDGNTHIVSWSTDGLAFKVHQRDVFMKQILPNYFGLTKYNSFTRQLQLWGFAFCRGVSNPKFGACKFSTPPLITITILKDCLCALNSFASTSLSDSHPYFIRGQSPSCLSSMKRIKIKGRNRLAGSKSNNTKKNQEWSLSFHLLEPRSIEAMLAQPTLLPHAGFFK
jgi:hypothetical protein